VANSALPNKPGILYVGVNDLGEILQDKAPESWQRDITAWGNGCFPELPVIPRTLTKDGKEFLAVVVPLSEARPHFARPAFKRQGAKTIPASQQETDEWIAYRNSKAPFILDWKHKTIHLQQLKEGIGGSIFDESGAYTLIDCNPWFVTLHKLGSGVQKTFPLSAVDLKMNDVKVNELMLVYRPYY